MEASHTTDKSARATDVHLRLLAEAASDALERQAANREITEQIAKLERAKIRMPWTKRRWY